MRNLAKKYLSLAITVMALGATAELAVPTSGQTPASPQQLRKQEKEFETAVEKHLADINTLLEKKHAPNEARDALLNNVSLRGLIDALRLYPPGTAVLFYSYGNVRPKETVLRVWLIGIKAPSPSQANASTDAGFSILQEPNDVIYEYAICSRSKNLIKTLEQSVDALQLALEAEARNRAMADRGVSTLRRAPHARANAGRIVITGPVRSLNEAISQVTSLILPEKIIASLANQTHPIRQLIIVPALDISRVPFALLQPSGDTYLIDDMSITMAPSLFNIVAGAKNAQSWSSDFENPLVVGNPIPLKDAIWDFDELPGAQREAEAVANLLNTRPILADIATKKVVVARAQHADLLYFATHGVADGSDPLSGSFLALVSPQTASGRTAAGRWTMREIEANRLTARLTVLSACATGLGPKYAGGIMHLARTFQVAGVPRVVMSLWNVDDEATAAMMPLFIKHLRRERPAEALRQAMLDIRMTRPAPLHWAAFTLFGAP